MTKYIALSRITPFVELLNKWLLINAFFMSQFSYCPLFRMCHRSIKNNIKDRFWKFEELREKDDSITIHKWNFCFLTVEMFKVSKGIIPPIVNEIFNRNEGKIYNLRNPSDFNLPNQWKECLVNWKLYHIYVLKYGKFFHLKLKKLTLC